MIGIHPRAHEAALQDLVGRHHAGVAAGGDQRREFQRRGIQPDERARIGQEQLLDSRGDGILLVEGILRDPFFDEDEFLGQWPRICGYGL